MVAAHSFPGKENKDRNQASEIEKETIGTILEKWTNGYSKKRNALRTYNRVSNTVHTAVFCKQFTRMYQQQSELTSSILFCVKLKKNLKQNKDVYNKLA